MNWTKEQKEAIDARGENILLAAAAGSGKTAVLVNRIIQLICDDKNPTDVNRLLVLTFTNAAASEMRGKISDALTAEIKKQPHNEHLKKQSLLIGSANISTVHSFCREILDANIHLTDIPADFKLLSQYDGKIMLGDCINDVLNKYYGVVDKHKPFRELASGYGGQKSDSELRMCIKNLFEFAMSMPNPTKWLNDTVKEYKKVYYTQSLYNTVWDKALKKTIRTAIADIEEIMEAELSFCEEYLDDFITGIPHDYTVFFNAENRQIQSELNKVKSLLEIKTENRYDRISKILSGISFKRLVTLKKEFKTPELAPLNERAKQYRIAVKDETTNLQNLVEMPENIMIERISLNYPIIKTLKNILISVMRRFKSEKREKGFLDFNDLEHEMLKLVRGQNGEPTETACILKDTYVEILVDEYQDTNYIQDAIFQSISRNNKNIFCVGDIKQSIYMFRNAVPDLFLQKYESYQKSDTSFDAESSKGRLIALNKNFRSRKSVIDTVNFIFENLMTPRIGGVNYGDGEKLVVGAEYKPTDDKSCDTEIIFIRKDEDKEKKKDSESPYFIEAKAAALKVRELVGNSWVTDKESNELRKAEYKDITILVRDANALATYYEKAFQEVGIPIYTKAKREFLETVEVRTVISFLQIADNPYRDIPLIAVMRSPIFAFSADELAKIRTYKRTGYFYDALLESSADNELEFCGKICNFLRELDFLRNNFEFADVHSLIWHIYYEYNYFSLVGVMDGGEFRQENLKRLYNIALKFENERYEGVFGFMKYIDDIYENKFDIDVSDEKDPSINTVSYMSIHQSKGLEFPVVILSGVSKQINFDDSKNKIIWNREMGISAKCFDEELNVIYPTITHNILSTDMKRNTLSEEMRLLYVALTRAKEKLVIITSEEKEGKWNGILFGKSGRLLECCKAKTMRMQSWIFAALCRHKNAEALRESGNISEDIIDLSCDFNLIVSECYKEDILNGNLQYQISESDLSPEESTIGQAELSHNLEFTKSDKEVIQANLFKEYKYKPLSEVAAKLSVTELKRMKDEAEDVENHTDGKTLNLFDDNDAEELKNLKAFGAGYSKIDKFEMFNDFNLDKSEKASNSEIGTIVHFVMQHIDFSKADTPEKAANELENMIERGLIDKARAEYANPTTLANFANSEICKRMLASKNVKKEFKFYITEPAESIYNVDNSDIFDNEDIVIQGIVDCIFEEEDGFVIIDYKTDRVKPSYLKKHSENYRTQLECYKNAVERIFNEKKVKQMYLCYLNVGKSIEIK